MKNSIHFAITYFALAKIGAVIVPMNFRLIAKELLYITEEKLTTFVKQKIASYKAPKKVNFVDSLPRNPSEKLLKYQLREEYDAPIG